jgi:ABC-type uncharacterized transport system substrate-binding protein
MKTTLKIFIFLLSMLMVSDTVLAGNLKNFSTTPKKNNGKKWNVGYYQGGDYPNYNSYLASTVKGLMDLGWIEETRIPEIKGNTGLFWEWLSTKAHSDYIQFVENAYYNSHWDKKLRKTTTKQLIKRLANEKDIDLMIAMGTWAGKDLSNNLHPVNTVIMSTSDPVRSGIIKSNKDSGFDHIHARIDPLRYERQIMIFHDMVGFKKLGVAYEDTVAGRSYAAVDAIEKVAANKGFEVVRCFTQSDISDQNMINKSVINCFEKLVTQVDAIYVTVQGGVNAKTIPKLVQLTHENKIPTFSQLGSTEVKQGFLLSIARKGGFKSAGRYFAALFAQIFNGAKPRELSQVFEEDQNFAINLKTAEIIGFYLYADIIAAADEIYRQIELPE